MSEATWVCDRRLCLTQDRSRVVEESDPAARWLWAVPGRMVPMSEAMRLGAVQHEVQGVDEAPGAASIPSVDAAPGPATKRTRTRAPKQGA